MSTLSPGAVAAAAAAGAVAAWAWATSGGGGGASEEECAAVLERLLEVARERAEGEEGGAPLVFTALPETAQMPLERTALHTLRLLGGGSKEGESEEEDRRRCEESMAALGRCHAFLYANLKPRTREMIAEGRFPMHRPRVVVTFPPLDGTGLRETVQEFESFAAADEAATALVPGRARPTMDAAGNDSPAGLGRSVFSRMVVVRHSQCYTEAHARCCLMAATAGEVPPAVDAERPTVNVSMLGFGEWGRTVTHTRSMRAAGEAAGARLFLLNFPLRAYDATLDFVRTVNAANEAPLAALAAEVAARVLGAVPGAGPAPPAPEGPHGADAFFDAAHRALDRARGGADTRPARRSLQTLERLLLYRWPGRAGPAPPGRRVDLLSVARPAFDHREWSHCPAWSYQVMLLELLLLQAGLARLTLNCKAGHDRTAWAFALAAALNSALEAGHDPEAVHDAVLNFNRAPPAAGSGAEAALADLRRMWTQNMLAVGVTVTAWNTGVPGFKYGAGELVSWFKRTFAPNGAPLPFCAETAVVGGREVRLVTRDRVSGHTSWTRDGTWLFDALGSLRSS